VEDFYHGQIAHAIVADMEANDGLIRHDDLAQIPWPLERRPLATWFDGHRVFTFGPPGAGRVLVEMLNVLDRFPRKRRDPDTPEGAVLLAEVIRQAQFDRHDRPFDPHFYPQVSGRRMVSRDYARERAAELRRRLGRHGETTHLSVMDAKGNAVALTQSIERVFGGFAASPELGFLYNNYLSAFEYEDMSHPYYLRPNAVPWASVTPTIVFHGRHPWAAVGSPGSERIVSAIVQVLLRLHDHTPFEAVDAPRLHTSIEGRVSLEAARMRDDIPLALEEHGLQIDIRDPYSFYMGCVQLALRDQKEFVGVADPRRDGSAAGPHRSEQ
jgi:gamma-glutamyltranspeptidase/glutathione hydrolase